MPKISVLMSVYNGEKYLCESIESILNQTFRDYEFLIINDGSTDGTAEILHRYAQQDKRMRIHQQTNQGLIAALNKGLEMARGKYIARMDADDVSLPERLAKQVVFLEDHPCISVLGTGAKITDGSNATSIIVQFPIQHSVLRWYLCFFNPIVHPSVMMRRQIAEQVGGYNSDMVHAEDYDLWRRLSCVTRLSNLQDVLLQLRKHDANVSSMHASEQRQKSVRISCLMISHILNEDVPLGIVQRLWDQEFQTASDVRAVAELVYKLYHAIVANDELPITEKRAIRRDAAMRMYVLSRPWVQDINVWGVLARACYLDPLLVLRVVKGRFHHIFHMRPRLLCWSF